MEVSAVNGATITFDTPLTYPFHTAYAAQLTVYTGVHSSTARASRTSSSGAAWAETARQYLDLDCAYCWVKNVEATWSMGSDIGLYETFRNVVRDSFVHETPNPNPGGAGYLTTITNGGSEN